MRYTFTPPIWYPAAVPSAALPAIKVVDATGSGPRTVAFALRDQGMGTTVLRGVYAYARPGVRVCFILRSGP